MSFLRGRGRVALTGIRQERRQIADFPAECRHADGLNVEVRCRDQVLLVRGARRAAPFQRVFRRRLWRGFSRASIAPWIR